MADLFNSDTAFKVLEKSMDISAKRHRLITNNIANVDTIGYSAKDIDFKKALQEALEERSDSLFRTHPKHIEYHPAARTKSMLLTKRNAPSAERALKFVPLALVR